MTGTRLFWPDALADLEAVDARHHHVQQHGVEDAAVERGQPLAAVGARAPGSRRSAPGSSRAARRAERRRRCRGRAETIDPDSTSPSRARSKPPRAQAPRKGPGRKKPGPASMRSARRARCFSSSASWTLAPRPTKALRSPSSAVSWRANSSPSSDLVEGRLADRRRRRRRATCGPRRGTCRRLARNSSAAATITRSCAGVASSGRACCAGRRGRRSRAAGHRARADLIGRRRCRSRLRIRLRSRVAVSMPWAPAAGWPAAQPWWPCPS